VKRFSFSPELIDNNIGEGYSSELWFCPSHTCVFCGALELPKSGRLEPHQLPSELVRTAASSVLAQRPLKLCVSCPQSVCSECEEAVQNLGREQRGRVRRVADKDIISLCTNCLSPPPLIKLAKLLERSLSRALRSKLAMPFTRPMIPIVGDQANSPSSSSSSSTTCSFLLDKPLPSFMVSMFIPDFWLSYQNRRCLRYSEVNDLLTLLERVRALQFSSVEDFLLALNTVMFVASERVDVVCEHFNDTVATENINSVKSRLLTALNSVVVLCLSFLFAHRFEIESATDKLQAGSLTRLGRRDNIRSGIVDFAPLGRVDVSLSAEQVLRTVRNLVVPISKTETSIGEHPQSNMNGVIKQGTETKSSSSRESEASEAQSDCGGSGKRSSSLSRKKIKSVSSDPAETVLIADGLLGPSSQESDISPKVVDPVRETGFESTIEADAKGTISVSMRMWRLECETGILRGANSCSEPSTGTRFYILPKTLLGWDTYISAGVMPRTAEAGSVNTVDASVADLNGLDFGSGSWIGKNRDEYIIEWVNNAEANRQIVSVSGYITYFY
jgi:hypothetical protein